MPIRYRFFTFPVSRIALPAATLALTLSAGAGQPLLPEPPPPVPYEELPGDAVPHDVVPVDPVPGSVTPIPSTPLEQHPAPPYVGPPESVQPYSPEYPAPFAQPLPAEPLPFDPHHDPFGPSPGPIGSPHGHGSGPPAGWAPSDAWTPPGPLPPTGPATLMRRPAPLAPLPSVDADPTLGPPPGTIGHTYYRPSRYVPADEHPRVGMLDLTLPPELTIDQGTGRKIRVTVHDVPAQLKPLEGYFGDDKHWHFESNPLTPGIPHLYRVKVERVYFENQEIRRYGRLVTQEVETGSDLLGVRYLRLIPGRIVTLEF